MGSDLNERRCLLRKWCVYEGGILKFNFHALEKLWKMTICHEVLEKSWKLYLLFYQLST